jgi:hypothetical protein
MSVVAAAVWIIGGTDPAPGRPVVVRVEDHPFHWLDAGVGAALLLAVCLLAAAAVLALRWRS